MQDDVYTCPLTGFSVRRPDGWAFMPGASLWVGDRRTGPCAADSPAGAPSAACRAFLDGSEKAREQWRLETAFARFEATLWPAP